MKSTEKQRKKCVNLAKKIARKDGICEKCGKSKAFGYVMHGSHIYPEGKYKSMSADVDNILCFCYYCHFQWWHKNPLDASDWFKSKYPQRAEILKLRAREIRQINWDEKYKELRAIETASDYQPADIEAVRT